MVPRARDRDSELAIAGHTTDTAGFTDLLFGVYDVVGLGFSPRIRDLADQRLWRLDGTALPDLVEPLMVNRVNVELIAAHWDAAGHLDRAAGRLAWLQDAARRLDHPWARITGGRAQALLDPKHVLRL